MLSYDEVITTTVTAAGDPQGFPIRTVQKLEDLSAIEDPEIDGVIWDRALPPFLHLDLSALPISINSEKRERTEPGDASLHVGRFLREQGFTDESEVRWMEQDVAALAARFARILSADHVNLRMEVVRDDACRKFHRDAVRARLICTYAGPSTQYAFECTGNEPTRFGSVTTGCPIVLKGKSWPGPSPSSLTHRSPPIEGLNSPRLVVVIDEARSV